MTNLLDLPRECLFTVFREASSRDLARLCATNKELHGLIHDNHLLHKQVYLRQWDSPPPGLNWTAEQWKPNSVKFAKMIKVLESGSYKERTSNFEQVALAIGDFLQVATSTETSGSKNAAVLASHFADARNIEAFLCQSSTFDRARALRTEQKDLRSRRLSRSSTNGLSAKLHCLYGVPITEDWLQDKEIYPYACSNTYDLRNYRYENLWGPFKDDGSREVDWEKVESVMIILGYNIRRYREGIERALPELWHRPFDGAWSHSTRSVPQHPKRIRLVRPFPKTPALEATPVSGDPYGVTGTWMRIVCFLDYQDLFRYNFGAHQPPASEPRSPIDIPEATRIITMQIIATKIEPAGEDDGQDYPVVHFKGISRATHHSWDPTANSMIRGTVRQTKEGEIRWTTFSVYYGEERWRSEGVQVGGVRSGRGVFGHWFDRNYDPQGPAGPTAFWKLCDEYDVDGDMEMNSDDDDSDFEP